MLDHAPRRRRSTTLVAARQWLEPTAADLAAIAAAAARPRRYRPRRSIGRRARAAAHAAHAAGVAAIVRHLDHAADMLHEIAAGIAAENA